MKNTRTQNLLAVVLFFAMAFTTTIARAADPLPWWNDGPARESIINFVTKVTTPSSPDFVPFSGTLEGNWQWRLPFKKLEKPARQLRLLSEVFGRTFPIRHTNVTKARYRKSP